VDTYEHPRGYGQVRVVIGGYCRVLLGSWTGSPWVQAPQVALYYSGAWTEGACETERWRLYLATAGRNESHGAQTSRHSTSGI